MIPSLTIEPIVVVVTMGLLLGQPLHLLLSSGTTRPCEWGHIISTSVIELEAISDTSHTLLVNKITKTRLG